MKKNTKTKIAVAIIASLTLVSIYYKGDLLTDSRSGSYSNIGSSVSSFSGGSPSRSVSKMTFDSSGFNVAGYDRQGYSEEAIIYKEEHNETFNKLSDNPIKLVSDEPISTFSSDVDDGSYRLFQNRAMSGHLLPKESVRVEEFINAFKYDYKKPENKNVPFSTDIEIAESPWSDNYLMKVGIKGYEYNIENLPPVNLVFLIDVSGSMMQELPIIKNALKMLVNKLRDEDSISLVTYAGNTAVVLESTKIENKNIILEGIEKLSSNGGTNGEAGITLAYKEAEKNLKKGGINRILLASDGDFNVGLNNRDGLEELIKEKRKSGITFSTIGIGGGNYRDDMMEKMANVGNGAYTFIGDMSDAKRVFADRFISTLKNIAKDVKFQVEFNPLNVKEYRLIGYENRMLKKEDFNNDKIDAGEIPSGVTTTAIYEITLVGQTGMHPDSRYDKKKEAVDIHSDELAFLKIRFKQPEASKSELLEFKIDKNLIGKKMNNDFKFAAAVAGFAHIYKDSDFISNEYNYKDVVNALSELELKNEKLKFKELVETVQSIKQ